MDLDDLDESDAASSTPAAFQGSGWDGRDSLGETLSMEEVQANPELAKAITAITSKLEERWLDQSLPALSGFTPRQAAADPTRRDDLIRLLENLPASGSPLHMDGERLRAALGL